MFFVKIILSGLVVVVSGDAAVIGGMILISGEITHWKQVGGKNEEIAAFQQNEDSVSQSMLQRFMGDTPTENRHLLWRRLRPAPFFLRFV